MDDTVATMNNRDYVEQIIKGKGFYPGDEDSPLGPVVRIVGYNNIADEHVYGIVYRCEAERGLWDKYMVE
jgi:hypothetical protein